MQHQRPGWRALKGGPYSKYRAPTVLFLVALLVILFLLTTRNSTSSGGNNASRLKLRRERLQTNFEGENKFQAEGKGRRRGHDEEGDDEESVREYPSPWDKFGVRTPIDLAFQLAKNRQVMLRRKAKLEKKKERSLGNNNKTMTGHDQWSSQPAAVDRVDLDATYPTVRLLFIGDSITRGMAQKNQRSKKAFKKNKPRPDEGLCSYRKSLFDELLFYGSSGGGGAEKRNHLVEFVGPETTAHGGPLPERCGKGGEESGGGVEGFKRSAATWGISLEEVLKNDHLAARALAAQSEKKKAWKNGDINRFALEAAPTMKHVVMRGEKIHEWVTESKPDLVFFLLGTNDLAGGVSPFELLHQRTVPALRQILRGGHDYWLQAVGPLPKLLDREKNDNKRKEDGADEKAKAIVPGGSFCPAIVVLAPLVPRNDNADLRTKVEEYNDLLAKQRGLQGEVCSPSPSQNNVADVGGHVKRPDLEHPDFNMFFCSSCVKILKASGGGLYDDLDPKDHPELYYDALHPNAEGEVLLGKMFARQLMKTY